MRQLDPLTAAPAARRLARRKPDHGVRERKAEKDDLAETQRRVVPVRLAAEGRFVRE